MPFVGVENVDGTALSPMLLREKGEQRAGEVVRPGAEEAGEGQEVETDDQGDQRKVSDCNTPNFYWTHVLKNRDVFP